MAIRIEHINAAFSPSREVIDPNMFAGRREEVKNAILALQNDGGFITIYGQRGVGKSSIALQIKRLAEGDSTLAQMLNLEKYVPKKGFDYKVHYFKCDKFVKNIDDLLKRILFGDDENPSLFSLTPSGEHKLESFRKIYTSGAELGFFGNLVGGAKRTEKVYRKFVSDDFIQYFRNILGSVRKEQIKNKKSKLLILIDEFDLIADKSGFASIVKACTSEFIKFGIVGISHNISELILDHGSIGRQIDAIRVRKMDSNELFSIIDKAEHQMRHAIVFDDDARELIVEKAEGFPYFVHLLGKEAALMAFDREVSIIKEIHLHELAQKISKGRLPTIYEENYFAAVTLSENKEVVLKALSEYEKEELPVEFFQEFFEDLGIKDFSDFLGDLSLEQNGLTPVLVKIREGYYRFSDPVFRVYAKLRHWEL